VISTLDDTKKLLVLSLGDEASKKVSQAIANDTARDILDLVADEPLSSSTIAERLEIPLTTVQYNIEKLTEAGLIDVKEKRWSKKGRTIKVYGPKRKLLIIVPENIGKEDILGAVRKYLGILLFAGLAAVMLEFITSSGFLGKEDSKVAFEAGEGRAVDAVPDAVGEVTTGIWNLGDHVALYFFAGALFVVLLTVIIDWWKRRLR
jgi:DNA-binding transcriptional ArsR family regulator